MGAHSPLEVEANGKRNYLTCVGSLSVVLIVGSTTMGSSLSVSSFTRIGSSVSANGSVILQGRLNSSGDVRGDRISATAIRVSVPVCQPPHQLTCQVQAPFAKVCNQLRDEVCVP